MKLGNLIGKVRGKEELEEGQEGESKELKERTDSSEEDGTSSVEELEEEDLYGELSMEDLYSEDSNEPEQGSTEDSTEEFNSSLYENQVDEEEGTEELEVGDKELKAIMDSKAKSGCNIVITGGSGSGVTTVAYNMANTIGRMGYRVLLVDLDTCGRGQNFINTCNLQSINGNENPLFDAISNSSSIESFTRYTRNNVKYLSCGIAEDSEELSNMVKESDMDRFFTSAKMIYDFVVYDMPLRYALDFCSRQVMTCDELGFVVDDSSWGVTSMILSLLNIPDEVLMKAMFAKTNVVFNRVQKGTKVLGENFNCSSKKWGKTVDMLAVSIADGDTGYYFSDMGSASLIPYSQEFPKSWGTKRSFSDTKNGSEIMKRLIKNMFIAR